MTGSPTDSWRPSGREYMEKLGYGDQPYIIFRHEDNARPHIHIVSLRIDEQGRKIRDYKSGNVP